MNEKKCIVFWRTKCEIKLSSFADVLPILAKLLKMIEDDDRVLTWGRCKGVVIGGKYYYNGFAIIDSIDNVEDVIGKFEDWTEFTRKYEFTDTTESKEILRLHIEETRGIL